MTENVCNSFEIFLSQSEIVHKNAFIVPVCERIEEIYTPVYVQEDNIMKKLVIFSGAGISQESGLPTFRGDGGIWDRIDAEKVADWSSWYCRRYSDYKERRQAVLDFFNPIRRMILDCEPNEAHRIIASLEDRYEVTVVTQNGDDLHERAGSSKVIHLHGEALKNTSTLNPYKPLGIDPSNPDIKIGDRAPDGSQIRPYVIFFNEDIDRKLWRNAVNAIKEADIMVVVGCSLKVHPAADMIAYLREDAILIVIDPSKPTLTCRYLYAYLPLKAVEGMKILETFLKEL